MAKETTLETQTNWERHRGIDDEVRHEIHARIDRILDISRTVDFEDSQSVYHRRDGTHLSTSGKFSISYILAEAQSDG